MIAILPVGPMGMYRWVNYFLKEWNVACDHVHGFNMDEWSDSAGNTLPSTSRCLPVCDGRSVFCPLGKLTVPKSQRNFANRDNLPTYAQKITDLKKQGAKLVVIYGIGRVCLLRFGSPFCGRICFRGCMEERNVSMWARSFIH